MNNNLYNKLINNIAKIVKHEINEAFDFSKVTTQTKKINSTTSTAHTLGKTNIISSYQNLLMNAMLEAARHSDKKLNLQSLQNAHEEAVKETCTKSSVIIDGQIYPSLSYKHYGLRYGQNFWPLPGYFNSINYGRKNDKDAVRKGEHHYKTLLNDVATHTNKKTAKILDKYIEKIKSITNFTSIKISKDGMLIAAIDHSKDLQATWQIWLTPIATIENNQFVYKIS